MSSDITTYLERLRTHLRLGDGLESDLVRELATHVEDRTEDLVGRGMPRERASAMAIEGLGRPRTLAHLLHQAHFVTPWRDALFGASAFVLLALLIGPGLWQQPVAAVAAFALIVGITVYGLWLGRPSWFYPWAGAALTIPIVTGYIAFEVLHREVPLAVGSTASPAGYAGIAGAGLFFIVGLVVVAAAVMVAVKRDWLDASLLLSPLPCALVWAIGVHRAGGITAPESAVTATSGMICGLYLCMAVVIVMFLRATTRNVKVTTLVASAVVLLAASTLLLDPGGDPVLFAGRAALLLGFLLSPALVARHA